MGGERTPPCKIKAQAIAKKKWYLLGADERTCKFSMMSWLFMQLNRSLSYTRHIMTF